MKTFLLLLTLLTLPFYSIQSFGQQWELQHPIPQAHDLTDIAFLDADNGWTGGAYGSLMKTSDGGRNWSLVNFPKKDWIVRLHFVTPDKGWVTTFEGDVFYTENQGASWVLTDYAYFLDMHFVNAELGFMLGYHADDSGCLIYRTQNGGATWEEIAQFEGYYLVDLEFVSDTKAWISGVDGVLFFTENAWEDWTLQATGTEVDLYSVSFSDTLNGWTAGTDYIDGEDITSIFHTSDGGQTWNEQIEFTNFGIAWMTFENETNGYLLGARLDEYELKAMMYRTSNGGIDWDSLDLGDVNLLSNGEIREGNIWLAGDNGRIVHSADQGNTWDNQVEILSTSILEDVQFLNDQIGWTVGNETVLKTENGGATWTKLDIEIEGYWENISVVDEQHVWIASQNLIATSNGGLDWEQVNTPAQYFIKDVVFKSPMQGWILVDDNQAYSTQDGGNTWDYHQLPGFYFWDMSFVEQNKGWIVGGSLIVSTTDGGQSWSTYDLGNYADLRSVDFLNDENGWAIDFGPYGIYYSTDDGGATWVGDTIPEASFLLDVHFVNVLQGWVVGVGGYIWYTEDGGETWLQQDAGTDLNLFSVHAVTKDDKAYIWVTGFNGMILYSTTDLLITGTETVLPEMKYLVSVYPNPAKDKLYVLLPDEYLIYDAVIRNYPGQIIKRLPLSGPDANISLNDIGPGQYLLTLYHDSGKYTTNFFVLK